MRLISLWHIQTTWSSASDREKCTKSPAQAEKFNHGEGISEKCRWIWLILGDFLTPIFKIFCSHGLGGSEKYEWIGLILGDF